VDELDVRLIELFTDEPRVGVLEASRRLGVARGTVQARLDRLTARGVVTSWGPQLSPEALGHPVTAFLTLEIRQASAAQGAERGVGVGSGAGPGAAGDGVPLERGHDVVGAHLAAIPEVIEVHTTTGAGDLLARVVARSNADLQRVIDRVLAHPRITRSSTVIALETQVAHRVLPLAKASVDGASAG
jgi:DNA-binding Lrp family transcriptional regulator